MDRCIKIYMTGSACDVVTSWTLCNSALSIYFIEGGVQRGGSGRRRATPRPPCPCFRTTTGRISVIVVKTLQSRSQKGPHNLSKMDRTWTKMDDFQPHTSPLTRTHTVKLPVRCDYSSFFSATRNCERIPSIDQSIV